MNKENDLQHYLSISPNKFGLYLFDTKSLKNLYKEEITFNRDRDFLNYDLLKRFLDDNVFKIEKLNRKFVDNEKFYFRGNQYRLSLIFGKKEDVRIVDGRLLVTCKDDRSIHSKNVKSLIEDWYVRESAKILNTRTYEFAKKIKVQPTGITIKNYVSKWGSCTAKNKISYNWRIIMAPDCIVDYLIIHELCHIIEHNHSKNFWNYVGTYCEDFQKKRKWLRENGHMLVL